MRVSFTRTLAALCVVVTTGCAVRQIPLEPSLKVELDEKAARVPGTVVAMVMDPVILGFRRERTYSLTQEERYDSGEHFMRSVLAHMRARGFTVLEVESLEQANELRAPYILLPDTPGLNIIRPKGLLDFSALGSVNRISVSYSVRLLKAGARIPERVSGSGSRTASFFWSNALLQTIGLSLIGFGVSLVIYGIWIGVTVSQALEANAGRPDPLSTADALRAGVPAPVAITVFIADILVSQITAQVVPRVINPLVDTLINEPRWQVMVQDAHDDAAEDLAENLAVKFNALACAPGAK